MVNNPNEQIAAIRLLFASQLAYSYDLLVNEKMMI
jgi:hypothetical protein